MGSDSERPGMVNYLREGRLPVVMAFASFR